VLITPSLGLPNWSVIYINTAQQSGIGGAPQVIWTGKILNKSAIPIDRIFSFAKK
jgi:hypothetical protein